MYQIRIKTYICVQSTFSLFSPDNNIYIYVYLSCFSVFNMCFTSLLTQLTSRKSPPPLLTRPFPYFHQISRWKTRQWPDTQHPNNIHKSHCLCIENTLTSSAALLEQLIRFTLRKVSSSTASFNACCNAVPRFSPFSVSFSSILSKLECVAALQNHTDVHSKSMNFHSIVYRFDQNEYKKLT